MTRWLSEAQWKSSKVTLLFSISTSQCSSVSVHLYPCPCLMRNNILASMKQPKGRQLPFLQCMISLSSPEVPCSSSSWIPDSFPTSHVPQTSCSWRKVKTLGPMPAQQHFRDMEGCSVFNASFWQMQPKTQGTEVVSLPISGT